MAMSARLYSIPCPCPGFNSSLRKKPFFKLTVAMAPPKIYKGLHLCEASIHKQFRSRDVAAVVGCERNHRRGDLIGCTEPAERNVVGNHFLAFLAHICGSEQVTQSGRVGAWAYRVYV